MLSMLVVMNMGLLQLWLAVGVPESKFNRRIDYDKLIEDYREEETDDWHEDSWEWQAWRNQELYDEMDWSRPDTLNQDIMLKKAQKNPQRIRLAHVYLTDGTCQSQTHCERIAKGWQSLILSGGKTSVDVSSPKLNRFLVEMIYGDFSACKDMLLTMEGVRKIYWNNYLLYPDNFLGQAEREQDKKKGFKATVKDGPPEW